MVSSAWMVRAWQIPVGAVLAGRLGALPLAPLADVSQAELPGVIRQMEALIRGEAAPETAGCSGPRRIC